jgi:hypothetical protein
MKTQIKTQTGNFKREFQVYRQGEKDKLTILSRQGENFDKNQKIAKYLFMGYQVFEMDGTEIKSI